MSDWPRRVWVIVAAHQKRHANAHIYEAWSNAQDARAACATMNDSQANVTLQVRAEEPGGHYRVDIEATMKEE